MDWVRHKCHLRDPARQAKRVVRSAGAVHRGRSANDVAQKAQRGAQRRGAREREGAGRGAKGAARRAQSGGCSAEGAAS